MSRTREGKRETKERERERERRRNERETGTREKERRGAGRRERRRTALVPGHGASALGSGGVGQDVRGCGAWGGGSGSERGGGGRRSPEKPHPQIPTLRWTRNRGSLHQRHAGMVCVPSLGTSRSLLHSEKKNGGFSELLRPLS